MLFTSPFQTPSAKAARNRAVFSFRVKRHHDSSEEIIAAVINIKKNPRLGDIGPRTPVTDVGYAGGATAGNRLLHVLNYGWWLGTHCESISAWVALKAVLSCHTFSPLQMPE